MRSSIERASGRRPDAVTVFLIDAPADELAMWVVGARGRPIPTKRRGRRDTARRVVASYLLRYHARARYSFPEIAAAVGFRTHSSVVGQIGFGRVDFGSSGAWRVMLRAWSRIRSGAVYPAVHALPITTIERVYDLIRAARP